MDLAALPEGAMRRARIGERIERLPPEEAAVMIEGVLRRAAIGAGAARMAALDLALWIIEARAPAPLAADPGRLRRARAVAAVREAAVANQHVAVAALLADEPAARVVGPYGRLAEVCIDVEAPFAFNRHWPIHIGSNLHLLERLRAHHDPRMIRRLLQQKRLRVEDVCLIAVRRPITAAIALEIALSPRWMTLVAVREALAENPFTPVGLAAPLVPTLGLAAQGRLRSSAAAHPRVEEAARALAALA